MSAEKQLFDCLEKIVKLQKSLYQIALKKKDILKADDVEALGQIMKDELKHIKAIEIVNNEREQIQYLLAAEFSISTDKMTISDILQSPLIKDKEGLQNLQIKLVDQTKKLKELNELNQQLLQQSLNFINLNLDILLGQQDSSNYTEDHSSHKDEGKSRSLFDSKA